MKNGTVAFVNEVFCESGLLKVSVDVGGEDEGFKLKRTNPFLQKCEAPVRFAGSVKVKTVSVKSPCKMRILRKPSRICHFFEIDIPFPQMRVFPPKSIFPPKIRQAGVNPHPRARSDQNGFALKQRLGGLFD